MAINVAKKLRRRAEVNSAVKEAKLQSAKRLCSMLSAAQSSGTLKPISTTAKPILQELRVKSPA